MAVMFLPLRWFSLRSELRDVHIFEFLMISPHVPTLDNLVGRLGGLLGFFYSVEGLIRPNALNALQHIHRTWRDTPAKRTQQLPVTLSVCLKVTLTVAMIEDYYVLVGRKLHFIK